MYASSNLELQMGSVEYLVYPLSVYIFVFLARTYLSQGYANQGEDVDELSNILDHWAHVMSHHLKHSPLLC